MTAVAAFVRLSAHTPSLATQGFFPFHFVLASLVPPSVVVSARSCGCSARLGACSDAGSSVILGCERTESSSSTMYKQALTAPHTLLLAPSRTRPLSLSLSLFPLTHQFSHTLYPKASLSPPTFRLITFLAPCPCLPLSPRAVNRPAQLFSLPLSTGRTPPPPISSLASSHRLSPLHLLSASYLDLDSRLSTSHNIRLQPRCSPQPPFAIANPSPKRLL